MIDDDLVTGLVNSLFRPDEELQTPHHGSPVLEALDIAYTIQ